MIFKKYKKYQLGGGNTINLSGPVQIDYYKNTKLNKKIIIISDIHDNMEGICVESPNTFNIINYIDNLFKTDIEINLFIEHDKSTKYLLKYNKVNKNNLLDKETNFMAAIINFGILNYKNNPTKKIYFTDIRNKLVGRESFFNFYKVYELFLNITQFKNSINLLDYYITYNNTHISTLLKIYIELQNKLFNNDYEMLNNILYPEYIVKIINKSDKNILNKLLPIVIKYFKDYLDKLFENPIEIFLNNSNLLLEIYKYGQLTEAALNNLCTILKILMKDNIKNSILYVGFAHSKIINNYLKSMNFELILSIKSNNELLPKCINDTIPFDIFFTQF